MDASQRITALEDVPAESTVLFRVTDGSDGEQEAILVATENGTGGDGIDGETDEDRLACWLNYCQHLTHIKIDKGSGASMRNGELVCANHGAYFDAGSGECTYGPCEGAYLTDLEVTVHDGTVYLTDDDYEYVGAGPVDDDDDLSSSSNVKI
ncbi:Rieske (2Fe-2S) iron-sulphur domain protein [Haloterrigena turkmenica DSM 5511]|uniref:Rieske (2Fe-2S) iron-sulphur domain protein n=1 Tax=Haloterrigena turkmenica (strain ATCC 51198 / DSM 5511 / JCM 9101 / NCIMB 13204 / VKM B-1734 / 4k) TaxID=543526 RepID=D2RPY9_HALTV|nr:Rieske 2Fe-2S domain-containing protein [Haloterrigena turkmenica]ADB60248.1 Rieske (2Fe-2S) iron-sulphur domain protein [Haloterrigena turkmenica DSM 5511]